MILLTPELRERLLANVRQPDVEHVPFVKFTRWGEGVWLAIEFDADGDTLFGLADTLFRRFMGGHASLPKKVRRTSISRSRLGQHPTADG